MEGWKAVEGKPESNKIPGSGQIQTRIPGSVVGILELMISIGGRLLCYVVPVIFFSVLINLPKFFETRLFYQVSLSVSAFLFPLSLSLSPCASLLKNTLEVLLFDQFMWHPHSIFFIPKSWVLPYHCWNIMERIFHSWLFMICIVDYELLDRISKK